MKRVIQKILTLEKSLKDLSKKVDKLDFGLDDLRTKLDLLTTKVFFEARSLRKDMEKYDKKNEKRFDKAMTHLVDIAGKFQKFDEEKTIISHRVSIHEDRIEKLEGVVLKTS